MFNKTILVGNLTRDIELRYTQGGMGIAKTAIATSRKFTSNGEKKEEVCFVDITFFARSAEVANQYLRKGSKILVEGRLNFEQWQDQNGQKRSKHSVVVETMQMLDSKSDSQNGGYAPTRDATTQGSNYDGQQSYQQSQQQSQQQSYRQPEVVHENIPAGNSRYDEPQQQSTQSMGYDGKPYVAPQKEMPKSDGVPVIDIDEDEIPF